MKRASNIISPLIDLVSKYESKLVDIFFWLFIFSFLIDRIINYFIHFPFFVGSALLIFPLLFLSAQYKKPDRKQLIFIVFSFILITIINSIIYLFGVKNISDLLFIILFITVYFYYKKNISHLKISNIYLFLGVSLFLFSFTFIHINSSAINKATYSSALSWITSYDEEPKPGENEKELSRELKWENNKLDLLEVLRVYHNGLFRIPHVASYFFGFLFLFFTYQYREKKKMFFMILLIVSLALCIYSGSRAILVAFLLSTILFLFNRKYMLYLGLLLGFLLALIVANKFFLQLSTDTIFFQYFAFIETSLENFSRLSRFRLWYSWWTEVSKFGFWDYIFGKSFTNALIANENNLNFKVWFHNDFLNIFYTYGIWCTVLYIWFFIKIYRDNKTIIRQNIFIFVYYVSMLITAFVNGFYYYFPVFLLYPFFLMIKNEKQLVQ